MEPSDKLKIVKILISESVLIENRKLFYDSLNLEDSEFWVLDNQFITGSITSYHLFSAILSKWVSANGKEATVDKLRGILTDNDFQSSADMTKSSGFMLSIDKLEEQFPTATTSTGPKHTPVSFEIGRVPSNFVGRSEDLARLKELFESDKYVVTITGMGGVGKSELARHFAHQLTKSNQVNCIWFNGQNGETLKKSVERLAAVCGVSTVDDHKKPKSTNRTFVDAFGSITSEKKAVVIIDNVDESDEDAQSLIISEIPQNHCFFIVTSRNLRVLNCARETIHLDVLSSETAQQLLKQSNTVEDESEARLCDLLQNFPLALQQATAYITTQKRVSTEGKSYKISDYIKTFKDRKKQVEQLNFPLSRIEHKYSLTTLITWNVSIDKIREDETVGPLAMEILNQIAYFEPDGIEIDFISLCQKGDTEKALERIKTYSLIKMEKRVVSIHRLIQQVIQLKKITDNSELIHLRKMANEVIKPLLKNSQPQIGLLKNLNLKMGQYKHYTNASNVYRQNAFPHIKSVWKHLSNHAVLVKEFKSVAIKITDVNQYATSAGDFIKSNYELLNRILGPNEVETLIMEWYAADYIVPNSGQLDSKVKLEILRRKDEVYGKQKSILGEGHKVTQNTALKIAVLRYGYGDFNKDDVAAEVRKVLETRKKTLGPDHKSTMLTQYLLASYVNSDIEALKLLKDCLEWQEAHFGEEHIATPQILWDISCCLSDLGNHADAMDVLQRLSELTINSHRALFVRVQAKLSDSLYYLGESSRAFEILQKYPNSRAYISVKKTEYEKAKELLSQGDFQKAFVVFKQIEGWQREFNQCTSSLWDKRWQLETQNYIAKCLIGLGEFKS